ncbi:hypothetical protein BCR36DRAFT_403511 [Piromyces finnis]|uniref:ER membrane protein complex subunit 7 beta-sandwich domain-containing protein n=1 Tax=Piromyces finnis TaxID=1754191 RepID=A0A1Y1VE91_9FUNG|nr:hypothetical protein BCR36DRAFT_403511 [Piromyces finnis]|eukprot:ORX53887.1 hypothetical protein BCR36DRAFT_403511 [Piromyces finnis]
MKSILSTALIIFIFNIISCYSASVTGRIYPNVILPDVHELSSNTEIILNGGEYVTYLKADSSFEIKNVKPGIYIAQINAKNYFFDKFWILVDETNNVSASKEATEIEFNDKFFKSNKCNYPLEVQAVLKKDYFEPRQTINILGFFKNPLVLLMTLSIGMMYIMPRLVSGLDEEELKEMKRNQGNVQDFMNKAQNGDFSQMFSNFLAEAQMASQNKQKKK